MPLVILVSTDFVLSFTSRCTAHALFLTIIITWMRIIKEPVYRPSESAPIWFCKHTCHSNMTGCWVSRGMLYLRGFAHDTLAANEVSQRLEGWGNATHVRLLCCWQSFDPSAGRSGWGRPFECKWMMASKNRCSLKSPYAIGPDVKDDFTQTVWCMDISKCWPRARAMFSTI